MLFRFSSRKYLGKMGITIFQETQHYIHSFFFKNLKSYSNRYLPSISQYSTLSCMNYNYDSYTQPTGLPQCFTRTFCTSTIKEKYAQHTMKYPQLLSYLQKVRDKHNKLKLQEGFGKELYKLQPIMNILNEVDRIEQEARELNELAADSHQDRELTAMAVADLENNKNIMEGLTQQLLSTLISHPPSTSSLTVPRNGRDVVLEMTAGVGGQEAMLFNLELFNMYKAYAGRMGWSFTTNEYHITDLGGLRLGSALVSGPATTDVYAALLSEAGVHRVQRTPRTEKSGRLHTSTAIVVVLLQPLEIDVNIQPKDLKIDTMKGSGPGGQSVNTTDSAVRITHIPSGVVVESRQERSQILNKGIAMARLRSLLYHRQQDQEIAASAAHRKLAIGSRGRSEKIRTYNFSQDRVTDHRIGHTVHNVAGVLAGGEALDGLMAKLREVVTQETLELTLISDP